MHASETTLAEHSEAKPAESIMLAPLLQTALEYWAFIRTECSTLKNGVKNIQDTTYNGVHMVDCCPKMCSYASQFKSNQYVNWLDQTVWH